MANLQTIMVKYLFNEATFGLTGFECCNNTLLCDCIIDEMKFKLVDNC